MFGRLEVVKSLKCHRFLNEIAEYFNLHPILPSGHGYILVSNLEDIATQSPEN